MDCKPVEFSNVNHLRDFVYHTLCQIDELCPGAFPMSERILLRRGRPCGILFCLHGPRSVRYTAIWETDQNTILFYDPAGERLFFAQLSSAPALAAAA